MSHKKLQGYWWLPWLFINFTSGFSSLQYTIRGNQSYESLPHFETKENNNIPPLYYLFSSPHIIRKHILHHKTHQMTFSINHLPLHNIH